MKIKKNDFYVTKEESRKSGPWKDSDTEIMIPFEVKKMVTLLPWQQTLFDELQKYDDRQIDILICPKGRTGKSSFVTYMDVLHDAALLPFCNDYRDIMRMAYDIGPKSIYLIDMPRAINKEKLYQFFSGIESLKSGLTFDDRYSFKKRWLPKRPRIVVFTNKKPDVSLLSSDMWKIWGIDENQLFDYTLEVSE